MDQYSYEEASEDSVYWGMVVEEWVDGISYVFRYMDEDPERDLISITMSGNRVSRCYLRKFEE